MHTHRQENHGSHRNTFLYMLKENCRKKAHRVGSAPPSGSDGAGARRSGTLAPTSPVREVLGGAPLSELKGGRSTRRKHEGYRETIGAVSACFTVRIRLSCDRLWRSSEVPSSCRGPVPLAKSPQAFSCWYTQTRSSSTSTTRQRPRLRARVRTSH